MKYCGLVILSLPAFQLYKYSNCVGPELEGPITPTQFANHTPNPERTVPGALKPATPQILGLSRVAKSLEDGNHMLNWISAFCSWPRHLHSQQACTEMVN